VQCAQGLTAGNHLVSTLGFLARINKALCNNGINSGVMLLDTVYEEIRYLHRGQFPFTDITRKFFSGLVQHAAVTPSNSFYWTLEDSTITLPVEITC